ncbi:hypothetical protein GOBAR_AA38257 [Gossypium barbadense]|uniref:Uncharacterized protein n=1 Tax=Gossypium barbadense TaxID=3634 RepID=A0A2P5VUF5_GOSBA|nr:hypothetical protein GOBAR_AA38257 [Gossypium barbadense]
MLSKFISVLETRFQNTEIALKNQQVSIQGFETQIGQLSKLISERPQGSFPSNTEPNLREQLNTINIQDEVVIEPEPELRQETVKMSLKEAHKSFSSNSSGLVHEDRRLQIEEPDEWRTHKPQTPDKSKLRQNEPDTSPNQLKVSDKALLDAADPHIVTTTLNEKIPLTVLSIFPFGTVEVSHPKFGTFKVNNTRLKPYFDEIDSRNEEYKLLRPPWPFAGEFAILGTMSSSRGKKTVVPASKKRKGASSSAVQPRKFITLSCSHCIDWVAIEQVQMADTIRALLTTDPWELFFGIIESTYLELTMELCTTFHLQTIMTRYDDPGAVQFCLGGLIRQLSVSKFGAALGLYMEEFKDENELHALSRHIHFSPSNHSKASVLPPSLRYLHAILTHTITRRRQRTGVINTHDVYLLWCMSQGHVIDLAYFIALAIQHQTERHQKGVISIGSSTPQPKNHPSPSSARCFHKASRACLA